MITVKVVEDSLSPSEVRLTTLSLVYPRFIHSELMTHRVLSRNAASSRAIPVKKVMEQLETNPAMPIYWGKNQKGMQSNEELTGESRDLSIKEWLSARDSALQHAKKLEDLGVHKQVANRILEPFMLISTIVTATDWDNFFNLRADRSAQPEFQFLAGLMLEALNKSEPLYVPIGHWHIPYVTTDEREAASVDDTIKYSVARCARVSYKTHEGVVDHSKDIDRHNNLLESGHLSPFEHQAKPHYDPDHRSGNFRGWVQYRKTLDNPYETGCSRLQKKFWLTPEEKAYLAILSTDNDLISKPSDCVIKELRDRGFSEKFITTFFNKLLEA